MIYYWNGFLLINLQLAFLCPPRRIVSDDDHQYNTDSCEHYTEGKHCQILHGKQEDTEKNPCNRNQRQSSDSERNTERAGGLGGMVPQDNNRCIDHNKRYKKREIGNICNKGNVASKYE